MQCRDIILEMAEEKKDQRQLSAPAESQHNACCDDGDQQAANSLAQDVEKKLTIRKPKVDEPQSHHQHQLHQHHQHSTIVCDAWYGLPTQKRPRRERVNAIARQLRNVEQSSLLATTKSTAANTISNSSKPGCGVRVVLVGEESDVQVIGERLEKLREENGGTSGESSCDSCRVEMLPNVSVSEACGTLRAQEADVVDEPASTAKDDTECHDKPIYLSPDADTTLDPRKPPPRTVVVGMLIDRRVQPNRSSERAEKIATPAARLPMDELKVEGLETNEALNVDTVLEMMVCWWNNVDGLHDGGGNAGNDDVDNNGNSFRRCFIAAASAAMVSHEDRHPNRAIHGTVTVGARDITMNSCDGSSDGSSGADLVLGERETIQSVDVTASHQRASPSSAAESPVPTMLPEQPEAVRVLTALLKQVPIPEEMSIAILRAEVEESGDANAAHTCTGDTSGGDDGGSGPIYPADAFKKVDEHLGLHAPDLPRLARDFRADYYRLRNLFRRESHQERYLDRHPNRQEPSVALSSSASSPPDDAAAALSASISADLVGSGDVASFDLDLTSGSSGNQRNIISPSTPGHAGSLSSSPNSGHNDTTATATDSSHSSPSKSLKEDEIDSVRLRRRIMEATSCLLLACPDNATAWSDRRRALLFAEGDAEGHMSSRKVKSIFISELKFLDLLFTTHSKAPNAWAHRKWICFRIVRDKISWNIRSTTTEDQWYLLQPWAQREIDLCTRVAEQFPNNYFAWGHRQYVISILFNHWPNDGKKYLSDVSASAGSLRSFLAGEVMFIEQWLTTHVSDHAAAHYGTEALRLHLKHGFRSGAGVLRKKTGTAMEWALAVAEGILITSRHLIRRYSSHEVIWNWRRHVGLIFMDIMCGEFGAERLVGKKAEEALNRFLQVHIYEVYDSIANGDSKDSTYKTKIEPEEEERRWAKIHSLTYLLWLLDQLQRRKTLLELANEEDRSRLNTIRESCKDTLAGDESLSYNTWRLKKVCEGSL